jgi:hypothetical protein
MGTGQGVLDVLGVLFTVVQWLLLPFALRPLTTRTVRGSTGA